jgi:hypothetical protein
VAESVVDAPEPVFPPVGTDPDLISLRTVAEILDVSESRAIDYADYGRNFPKRTLIAVSRNRHRPIWSRAAVTAWARVVTPNEQQIIYSLSRWRRCPAPRVRQVETVRSGLFTGEQVEKLRARGTR